MPGARTPCGRGCDVVRLWPDLCWAAVDVQLSHPDTAVLARASGQVADVCGYADLKSVENTYVGKAPAGFHAVAQRPNLGLTTTDVARQLRASLRQRGAAGAAGTERSAGDGAPARIGAGE